MRKKIICIYFLLLSIQVAAFEPVFRVDDQGSGSVGSQVVDAKNLNSSYVILDLEMAAKPKKIGDRGFVLLREESHSLYRNLFRHYIWVYGSMSMLSGITDYTSALDLSEYGVVAGGVGTVLGSSDVQDSFDNAGVSATVGSLWVWFYDKKHLEVMSAGDPRFTVYDDPDPVSIYFSTEGRFIDAEIGAWVEHIGFLVRKLPGGGNPGGGNGCPPGTVHPNGGCL